MPPLPLRVPALVLEPDSYAVIREAPEVLHRAVVELTRPLAFEEGDYFLPTLEELVAVAPLTSEPLVRPLPLLCRLGAQPQGGVLGLHGAPDHPDEAFTQGVEVGLLSQPGAEGGQRFGGVVLVAVEAPVHEPLHPAA